VGTDMPEAAKDQPWQRSVLMIGAHLVWGSILGLVTESLPPREPNAE
jgi:hypothetical protein